LACELSDKIAAIAPTGAQGTLEVCAPKRKVPVLYFHGTADPCSPYQGGTAGGCFESAMSKYLRLPKHKPFTWQIESVPVFIQGWVTRNGLPTQGEEVYRKGEALCTSWGRGLPGEVALCSITGMGHVWPGKGLGKVCRKPESRACRIISETLGPLSF